MLDDSIRLRKSALLCKKTTCATKERTCRRYRTKSPSPGRRGVSFAPIDTILFSDQAPYMSKKEKNDAYYSHTDLRLIKLAVVPILRKMIKGTYKHELDCLENETRGLESMTPKGSKSRKKKKRAAFRAVLDEQDRQRLQFGRTVDSERIAELYRERSSYSQIKATQAAANDASLVQVPPETALCAPEAVSEETPNRQFLGSITALHKSGSSKRLLSMIHKSGSSKRLLSMIHKSGSRIHLLSMIRKSVRDIK